MRKLNTEDYTVKVKVPDPANPGREIEPEFPYRVKDSLVNILFFKGLGLNGAELIKANILAQKILTTEDGICLLEEAEWQRLKNAVEVFKGFQKPDVELVTRILAAEEVEVEPKK